MRSIILASFIGLSMLSSHASTQTTDTFYYEGWTGHKRIDDPDKGCIMGKHVTRDVYFLIYANANEAFSIGVTSDKWTQNIAEEIAGTVRFDDEEEVLIIGSVVEPKIALFYGGAEEDSFETLVRNSRNIRFSYGHDKFGLSLKGSSKAIDLLYSCAEGRESTQQTEPRQLETAAPDAPSLYNLPIKAGYYALTGGTCSEGFGSNTIYTDGKTLSWPSSGCRFEHIKQTGSSTFQVMQTCGRNVDDIETKTATYTLTGSAAFSLKSGEWETKGEYCEPSTLPHADQERTGAPIYARSSLGETAAEKEANETTQANESARVLQMLDDLGKKPRLEKTRPLETQEKRISQLSKSQPTTDQSTHPMRMDDESSSRPDIKKGKPIQLRHTDENKVRETVSLSLPDETSGRFRNIAAADMEDGTYVVCGFVNGKNQFGAYTGYQTFFGYYRPDVQKFTLLILAANENAVALCIRSGVEFK